jgi:hypothetical protein
MMYDTITTEGEVDFHCEDCCLILGHGPNFGIPIKFNFF